MSLLGYGWFRTMLEHLFAATAACASKEKCAKSARNSMDNKNNLHLRIS